MNATQRINKVKYLAGKARTTQHWDRLERAIALSPTDEQDQLRKIAADVRSQKK